MNVSVIVPLYKGEKYVKKQINQVVVAAKQAEIKVELILVNDDPTSRLPYISKEDISIIILETRKNTGIQSARIRGLSVAKGEYIHFLDQDDEIEPDYYRSQLAHIGNSNAVYCRCYNGDRQTYNYDRVFETAFDKEHIFNVCPVISPGQVLIRRNSMPAFWEEHILKNIGSDDYFLWLCMVADGCSFVANQEILYTHIRNGENYSADILRTRKSDDEMIDLLLAYRIFNEKDRDLLKLLPEKQLRRRYEPQRKDQIVLQVLSQLLRQHEKGNTLENFFAKRGIMNIAIYGAAVMGERIKGLLHDSKIRVSCFIDKNAPFIEEDIPVYKWGEDKDDFEAVVISNIENEDLIAEGLIRDGVEIYKIRGIVKELADE